MNKKVKIKIHNNVWSSVKDHLCRELLYPCLSYEKEYWKQEKYGKKRHTYRKCLIGHNGYFLSGHLTRVINYCNRNDIEIEWEGALDSIDTDRFPYLNGITFREDQMNMMLSSIAEQRGVIKCPTGSGKTLLILGIMSCFPDKRILFLCHLKEIFDQTIEALGRYGFKDIGVIGDKEFKIGENIWVAIVNSYHNYYTKEEVNKNNWDIIIVDECHHISGTDRMYYDILTYHNAPMRLGFTATYPKKEEEIFALEGCLGELIGEVTVKEGIESGFLSKPKVKIISVPVDPSLRPLSYKTAYQEGIVNNKIRNRLIADTAKKINTEGKTVLVVVKEIEHGNNIIKEMEKIGLSALYVNGQDGRKRDEKREIRHAFDRKEIMTVVATCVWKEGVNIPNLDCVLLAAGGRKVEQQIGRGFRKTKTKDEFLIIDLFDNSNKSFVSQFGERIAFYCEMEWL
jgi:superfamily II DNA or RNA helicase